MCPYPLSDFVLFTDFKPLRIRYSKKKKKKTVHCTMKNANVLFLSLL